jgi:hypothetical protein
VERLPWAYHWRDDVGSAFDDHLDIAACKFSDPMMTVFTTIEVSLNQPYNETSGRLPWWPSAASLR